jgi:hypothetical protein
MDIGRFLSLLTTEALYFARADTLGDPLEGTITSATVEHYHVDDTNPMFLPGFQQQVAKIRELLLRNILVSCWHINDHESVAMWELYANQGKGIAIRSTYRRLLNALSGASESFYIGQVKYVDYDSDTIVGKTLLAPFICKQRPLEHERELRVVIGGVPIGDSEIEWSASKPRGVQIPINRSELIEAVIFAPRTESWIAEAFTATMRRIGVDSPVRLSAINRAPILG